MDEGELRRLAGQALLSRAQNEEALAIQVVAADPSRFVGIVGRIQKAKDSWEKKQIFNKLTKDEQLGFVFMALSPGNIDKVMDYLARRM